MCGLKRAGNKTTGVHMGVHISKNGLFREKKPVFLQQAKSELLVHAVFL